MHSDWLSPVLQIVQNTDAAKRNSKMSLLKSLSREGSEEMATASAKTKRRYWALEQASTDVVSEVLANQGRSI